MLASHVENVYVFAGFGFIAWAFQPVDRNVISLMVLRPSLKAPPANPPEFHSGWTPFPAFQNLEDKTDKKARHCHHLSTGFKPFPLQKA
uniref:Transmembrane protein n=1 Tax=Panagrellus redivivus TaxID=6233 RepID=A0A7E4VF05_PANRE